MSNYCLKEYTLGNTIVAYLLNERKNVSMFLYPKKKRSFEKGLGFRGASARRQSRL